MSRWVTTPYGHHVHSRTSPVVCFAVLELLPEIAFLKELNMLWLKMLLIE